MTRHDNVLDKPSSEPFARDVDPSATRRLQRLARQRTLRTVLMRRHRAEEDDEDRLPDDAGRWAPPRRAPGSERS